MLCGFQSSQRGELDFVVGLDRFLLETVETVTQRGIQGVVPFEFVLQVMDFIIEDALTSERILTSSSPIGVGTLSEIEAEIALVGPAFGFFLLCETRDGKCQCQYGE